MLTPGDTMTDLNVFFDSMGRFCAAKAKSPKNRELVLTLMEGSDSDSFREELYRRINNLTCKPTCKICNTPVKFISFDHPYNQTCSKTCAGKLVANDPLIQNKKKKTNLVKYGVDHWTKNKKKIKQQVEQNHICGSYKKGMLTFLENYGCKNQYQRQDVKAHIKKTMLNKHGYDNAQKVPEIRARTKATNVERYGQDGFNPVELLKTMLNKHGYDNAQKVPEIRARTKATNVERYGQDGFNPEQTKITMLNKYGAEYALQNPEIFDRAQKNNFQSRYKLKKFITKTGKLFNYQGFENYVINLFIESGVDEDDIENERSLVPVIKYNFENKNRIYYPDFYIACNNLLVEVKSSYTMYAAYDKNIAKHRAAVQAGYRHMIIVWSERNNCLEEIIELN